MLTVNQLSPPVGVYSPKYDLVTSQGKAMIKFNYSPSRDQGPLKAQASSPLPPSKIGQGQSRKSLDLPSIVNMKNAPQARDMSVPPQHAVPISDILKSHVPNFQMSKLTSRKDNAFQVILNDDSHIEYNNIFPKILSKNRKITIDFSLDRMVDRKEIVDNRDASFPMYNPVYSLVDKKIKVPSIGSRRNSQKRN